MRKFLLLECEKLGIKVGKGLSSQELLVLILAHLQDVVKKKKKLLKKVK